jgi:hypothetical protein
MARVNTGNPLTTAILQPGARFQTDGYGLVTGVAVFKEDVAGSSPFLARGQPFPGPSFTFCNVHKASSSLDALGISTYTVEYVGISVADAGSSTITKPQITGSQGLTSEHITSHPNFFELATGFTGTPIAGVGAAPGTIDVPNYAATGDKEFTGNNGSTFEKKTGGKFLGFKQPKFKGFYGKTNYLAPQTSFTGHFYTSQSSVVTSMRDRVGKTSGTNQFNSIKLVPDYVGTVFVVGAGSSAKNQLLLTQVSFEDYALLYKVTYEVRYNREGYEPSVYASA